MQVRRRVTAEKSSRPQSEVINQILIEKFKVRNILEYVSRDTAVTLAPDHFQSLVQYVLH